jgi:hypothetical protein
MNSRTLEKAFNHINDRLFDGLLDMPKLLLVTEEDMQALYPEYPDLIHHGLFFYEHNVIAINDESDIFSTLVHEMIHLWQFENKKYMGHEGWFRIWCEKAYEEFYR